MTTLHPGAAIPDTAAAGGDVLRAQLRVMAELQAGYNDAVAADWRSGGLPFHRAIWVECAEMLDHLGWKWWKHQEADLEQVRLELVDIWHFGLSDLLARGQGADAIADAFALALARAPDGAGRPVEVARRAIEMLAAVALTQQRFDLDAFAAAMRQLDVSSQALFEGYVGKNVLNRFRLANGYRDGSYRKLWQGIEDNVHLAELLRSFDLERPDLLDALHAALTERYRVDDP